MEEVCGASVNMCQYELGFIICRVKYNPHDVFSIGKIIISELVLVRCFRL